jgi:hypothetical protein
MPRTPAGRTYKQEWQALATYLHTQWPGVRAATTGATAIWLLEYLRRIETSGVLPSYDYEGQLVQTVGAAAEAAGMVREPAKEEKSV